MQYLLVCVMFFLRTNHTGKNSHWVKDLNIQDQKDLSTCYCKMKKVCFGPKRVKISNHKDGINDYSQKGKKEDKAYDTAIQVEKANNNEKEKEANNNRKENEKIYRSKIEKVN